LCVLLERNPEPECYQTCFREKFNITLTLTLKSDITVAQKNDEGMGYIKRRMQKGDPNVACFHEDAEGTL
jgi:hypothetical protein